VNDISFEDIGTYFMHATVSTGIYTFTIFWLLMQICKTRLQIWKRVPKSPLMGLMMRWTTT
jgi:hypothetical protein